ncbi:MAG: hypothetical protein GTO02_15595, partial [Candidatus Dadabacteria bacterium]|nr:hypothetical protein [Candidatus Dadabacteria bacterium]NIQ15759.1 hypothetical protein [Candidatus Dadabacteria bacterium]
YLSNSSIPYLSEIAPDTSIEDAYAIQNKFVKLRLKNDRIYGFKAGLSSERSQKKYKVKEPLVGVLFLSGKHKSKTQINNDKKYYIELEIGFVVKNGINRPINSISELKKNIKYVVPVVEMPNINFDDMKSVKAIDIIAANLCSSDFITGDHKNFDEMNLNTINALLYLGDDMINTGKGTDAMGDQWEAVLWLVNKVVKNGFEIKRDNLLITGLLGKLTPAKRGKYTAKFGELGDIDFKVE